MNKTTTSFRRLVRHGWVALLCGLCALLPAAVSAQTYNTADIAAINAIITAHQAKLTGWVPATPADGSVAPTTPTPSVLQWTADATNKRIKELDVHDLDLTGALDVSALTGLVELWCNGNQLTSLTVAGLANLESFNCSGNPLGTLNLSGLTSLKNLVCENNQLSTLNLSGLTNLEQLWCKNNLLTGLDISGNNFTASSQFDCSYNKMTSTGSVTGWIGGTNWVFNPQNTGGGMQFMTGSGTQADPFIISTAQQLDQFAVTVNYGSITYEGKHIKLGADIDLGVAPYNAGTGWTPIGTSSRPFKGIFDGDGKKISNLYINNDTLQNTGLFGAINGGKISNLTLENVNITAKTFVGGIVGRLIAGSIDNCSVSGNISGNEIHIGGIAGWVGAGVVVDNSSSSATVSGKQYVGGVAGSVTSNESATGIVRNCSSSGNVSGDISVGGIAGEVRGKVEQSHSTGNISGNGTSSSNIGGVVGHITGGSISDSYATGAVSGLTYLGGVAGRVVGNIDITDSYATGNVSAGNSGIVGGIAGYVENGRLGG